MATTKRLLPRKIPEGATEADLPRETKGELQARTRYEVRIRRPDGKEVSRTFRTMVLAEQLEREQRHARDRGAMHDPQVGSRSTPG